MLDLSRFVAKGAAILQPHQLLDELSGDAADDADYEKLKSGPFGVVLHNCQVGLLALSFIHVCKPRSTSCRRCFACIY